jgi:DNA-binding MarR family transcriptional regulator
VENVRSLLHSLSGKYESLQKNVCRSSGSSITVIHHCILYEINKHNKPSMHQVAAILGTDITTFSRQIHTLIREGLVKKSANPKDKRMYFLSLTEKGTETADHINSEISKRLDGIFEQLSDFERSTVIHSLQILNRAMKSSLKTERVPEKSDTLL